MVASLAMGSIPGSILGVGLLRHLRTVYCTGVNMFITMAVGIMLIVVPTALMLQTQIEEHVSQRLPKMQVGSGSIIIMLLLVFYSFPPRMMVGTDIVHGVVLTGMTSLLHFTLHNIDRWDRLNSWCIVGVSFEHANAGTLAETHLVCGFVSYRRAYALGLIRQFR